MIARELYEQFSGTLKPDSTEMTTQTESKLKRFLGSVGAVVAGLFATIVLSISSDLLMHATSIYPPWGEPMSDAQFSLATIYRSIFGVLGGYITARLAAFQPMEHALALGLIGFVLAIIGTVAYLERWTRIRTEVVSNKFDLSCYSQCLARRKTSYQARE